MTVERAERLRQAALAAYKRWEPIHNRMLAYKEFIGKYGKAPPNFQPSDLEDVKQARAVLDQAMTRYKDALKALGVEIEGFNHDA